MSSGVGGSRVSIPNNVRKTIHDIREITGKQHSDDEIYAVLKECSMDPNETAQKLLYLDTFHEVKRRRDRRKENLNSKASEERPAGTQRRGARGGGQGNYGSNFSSEAGGGKNAARRENGASHPADRGSMSSSFPFSQRTKHNAASRVAKATALPNGTANLPNGTSTHGTPKSSVESEGHSPKEINKLGPTSTQPAALGVTSSPTFGSMDSEQPKSDENLLNPISGVHSSDSLSTPSGSAIMVENEAGAQQLAAEPDHVHEDKTVYNDDVSLGQSESDQAPNVAGNKKNSSQPMASEASQPPPLSTCEVVTSEAGAIAAEVCCQSTSELHVSDGQHVTFPNHFQVPEALKSGLTFGSFDVTFGSKVESGSFGADDNVGAVESPVDSDEAAKEPSSDQNVSSIVQGDYLDDSSQSLPHVLEKLQPSEGSTDSKVEQPKQETQYPEGPQNPSVINGTSYSLGLGIMPPMVGSQLVQMEGHEAQAHETRIPNIANGNSPNPPSTNPSPPLPSSIAVSPQSVPVFRQTYPPNFFPYGQYLSPFYMPPMHQFLGHNGFPTQPSTGNVYLPPAPAGVKFSLPQFKPGNNAGNATHIGIQPAGSFITAPVGYAQPVTSGSSMGNEDLVASHLKENQIYTTGQLTEGSAVWIQAAGQDAPSLQVNSLYNLPPQGHIAFSPQQSGHGAFAGIFPPGHAMTAPSTLLQQSQAAAGAIETIGPPSGAYQQSQHAQINWNTAF